MAKRKPQSTAEAPRGGRIARMRSAITRNARSLGSKIRHPLRRDVAPADEVAPPATPRPRHAPHAARPARRLTDVPFDLISRTYTPTQTSLKGPFRENGMGRQRDQEFPEGYADETWNDEDRYTNKSGDRRIGTHRRTYEPGERDEERGE